MKGTAFIFIILTSGLLIVGARADIASNSDTARTSFNTQSRQERIRPDSRVFIADRIETQDRIIYGTDPGMERAMTEQERFEKEKEDKSWDMLRNMNIYKGGKRPNGPNQPDKTPQ